MKRRIYTKEWLKLHPYEKGGSTDRYYTDLANRIYLTLQNMPISFAINSEARETISLCISAWFEDIISKTGMWQVFTTECERRYGSRLPFYHLNEYYPDEINVEDVRFLIWHYMQLLQTEHVINPEDPNIEEAANSVYALLDKEYENAPENEQLQLFFEKGSKLGKNDFYQYRKMLEWFHYSSYLTIGNSDILLAECEKVIEEDIEKYGDNLDIVLYATQIGQMLKIRSNLLGWNSPTWLKHIFMSSADGPVDAPWADVKSTQQSYYLYTGEDDMYIYVKDLCETDDDFRIIKESLNMSAFTKLEPDKTILSCILVRYGGDWWQNGMLVSIQADEQNEDLLKETREKLRGENDRDVFRQFMRVSEGRFIVFCKGKEGIINFYTQKMGYKISPQVEFPEELSDSSYVALSATPKNGLYMQVELVDCINAPDNPSYDRQTAEKNALALICNPDVVCYEMSCIMQDKGMISDATLGTLSSKEDSQLFVRNNARFLTDYFFRNNREEAFSDPDLKEWILQVNGQ